MNEDIDKQIAAIQTLLESIKNKKDTSQVIEVWQTIMPILTSIYQVIYQRYLSIGAPGGESHEQFHTWLKNC